jgi:dUTPase
MNFLQDPFIRSVYSNLKNNYASTVTNFCILKLAISDSSLNEEYIKRVGDHNKKIISNLYVDSGFDVYVPSEQTFNCEIDSLFIDMQIKTEMLYCNVEHDFVTSSPFLLYPRSSIAKTPLMLANHVGVIDAGYRGPIIGAFRWLANTESDDESYVVAKDTRLVQICHPSLCPIFVVLVDESTLTPTERGIGGFGSTGK